jgi:FMN reductase
MVFEDGRLRVVGIGGTLRGASSSLGALRRALEAAKERGVETELLDLRELNLPMYEPGRTLDDYGPEVRRLVEAMRGADALILSTAAYHGTLAGVTKNALDFTQFLAREERPYLDCRVVGLISTAGGEPAAANTTDAMVHVVHALRDIVAPSMVTISKAWQRSDGEGNIIDEDHGKRPDRLGKLVVEMAEGLNPENRHVEAVGVAV